MASALSQAKSLAKYNNELEKKNVALQYSYNKSLAEQDRSWQERMANSAHQREIADLKAAGLNPVLTITGGNGATTPSGSSASVSKPNVDMSLPRAVMDMAIAQLNSATAIQTTAMQNANALQVVYDQGIETRRNIRTQARQDRKTKKTISGDSYYGQYTNAKNDLLGKVNNFLSSYPTDYKSLARVTPNEYLGIGRNEFEEFFNSSGDYYWSNKNSARKNERINRRMARKERRKERKSDRMIRRYERRYKRKVK